MKTITIATSLALAGLVAAGGADDYPGMPSCSVRPDQ